MEDAHMSTVIYDMLKEEKQRNLEMQETYKREIDSLRKGSIMEKRVWGQCYLDLTYRHGKNITNDYIG
jgi:hypothetical protein